MAPDPKLIELVEQRDVQHDFRDPTSHRWTVAHESRLDADMMVCRSALFVEPSARQHVIETGPDWPHRYENGPAFVEHWAEEERVREYLPTGNDDGLHPLVITQTFHGLKPDPAPRLIDEFVLFHNLWRDENGHYFKLLDDGRADPVGYFQADRMLVRTDLLRQFQAARQWDLVLCIDSRRFQLDAPGVDIDAIRDDVKNDLENTCLAGGVAHSIGGFTRFFGVRAVPAPPFEQSGTIGHGDNRSETYPELIIDIDDNGAEVTMACGPDLGPNDFLRIVHFRREVLAPYYERPDLFTVDESGVTCGEDWSLRVHGVPPGNLFAHLGDFGQELPEAERRRWANFNEAPAHPGITDPLRRELASTSLGRRGIDLEFQRRYRSLNEAWTRRFGWPFFMKPTGDDVHLLKRVRIPLNDGIREFEEQLLVLARLVVDSLNVRDLSKAVGAGPPDEKSIAKLERFLAQASFEGAHSVVEALRDLQSLRSKVAAHKKSSKADAVVQSALGTNDPVAGIMRILIRLCEAMSELEEQSQADDPKPPSPMPVSKSVSNRHTWEQR